MANIPKNLIPPNADEDAQQQKLSVILSRNSKWYSPFGRQFVRFLGN